MKSLARRYPSTEISKSWVVGVVKDFYNYSFRANIDPICIMAEYHKATGNFAVNMNMANMKPTLSAIEKIWT